MAKDEKTVTEKIMWKENTGIVSGVEGGRECTET
jgi:hypothetical protein